MKRLLNRWFLLIVSASSFLSIALKHVPAHSMATPTPIVNVNSVANIGEKDVVLTNTLDGK